MDKTSTTQYGKSFDWIIRADARNCLMASTIAKSSVIHPENVALRLRAVREAAGFSKADVADIIELDRSSYTKVEKGTKPLLPNYASAICDILGCDMDYLYRGRLQNLPDSLSSKVTANLKAARR